MRVGADRADEQPEREPAEQPRPRVEDEQAGERASAEARQLAPVPEAAQDAAASGRKTRGWTSTATTTPNASSGTSGAPTSSTKARPTTKTITPATAEIPASSRIDEVTSAASVTPERRTATTRAAGVQTPPGTYFATIDSISARSAAGYEIRISHSPRIHIQPSTKTR